MGMQTTPMIEMDFAVIKEDFSRYLIHDGAILKVKIVVKKILRTAELTAQGYPAGTSIDSVNAVAAIVPQALKREPSKEPWDPRRDVGEEVKFEPQEEKWQEYMTTEGYRILIKPVLTKVFRYNKYNDYGEPIYSAVIQSITNIEKLGTTATT
ncbi:MAG: hypothetical protein HXX80_02345 [Nitrososphaerales archaeon]|nr:hypothetical protein [Nitrososphaerales archaeon]